MPFVLRRTNAGDPATGFSVPARTGITMEIATLHQIEPRRYAVRLEPRRRARRGTSRTPGFRTTKERSASPLHHDMTQNSVGDSREIAESVPSPLA
jgi:hypothetical protein